MTTSSQSASNLATVVAVAIAAYATCDMVHEVLGHGFAVLLSPNVRALSLTTVALQTDTSSRFVAAAGSIANIVFGVAAAILFRRRPAWNGGTVFLGLLALTNLLNGTGYWIFSGLLGIGDWAVVVAGMEPAWVWRAALVLVGASTYALVVQSAARLLTSFVRRGVVSRREPARVLIPAYLAGGLLFVLGSALNPIGPSLIVTSGVSSGFGAMAGLAFLPSIVEAQTREASAGGQALPFSWAWCVVGAAVALVFVGLLGPGIRL